MVNGMLADIATATEQFGLVLRGRQQAVTGGLSSKLSCQEWATADNFRFRATLDCCFRSTCLPSAADRQD
jgi:hypothetical protein